MAESSLLIPAAFLLVGTDGQGPRRQAQTGPGEPAGARRVRGHVRTPTFTASPTHNITRLWTWSDVECGVVMCGQVREAHPGAGERAQGRQREGSPPST